MHNDIITQTEQALARIFAICNEVAKTGETIRSENEGEEAAKAFLGNDKAEAPSLSEVDPPAAG